MVRRLPLIVALTIATLPFGALADAPDNDHWLLPTEIDAFPYEAEVDFAGATRDPDLFWDCLPTEESPGTPLTPRYGDVWFKVVAPPGTRLIATAEVTGGSPILGLYDEASPEPDRESCDDDLEPGDPASIGVWIQPGESQLIQLGACRNCAQTTVTFRVFEPQQADLGVHSLTVTRPVSASPVGDLPRPTTRDIAFSLQNDSGTPAGGIWRVKACHTHDSWVEYCVAIASGLARLKPGQETPITAAWDATGSSGDFTICAVVSPFDYMETNWPNNRMNADTWVLASNTQGENWIEYLATGGFSSCYHHYWFH